jgi:sugar phosphate isomerase/epimerase
MRLGLHAYSLQLAAGLREYQPVGRGLLTPDALLEKAARLKCTAVQLARGNITDWGEESNLVTLANLGGHAAELGLLLHLSTNVLEKEHLVEMIHAAHTAGAPQVTVPLSLLQGNVQQRQRALERLLVELDPVLKTAERYKVTVAFENGRHTAAADLAAFVQAAQHPRATVCFDVGNPLTVPESPVAAAETLAPYCTSVHLKDWQAFRTMRGLMLVNCPVGEGMLEIVETLRVLKARPEGTPLFLQTGAERTLVPVLEDDFLVRYPRITARALAALLRRGSLVYQEDEVRFPHELRAKESEILKWEEDRVKRSLKKAHLLMGTETLTLELEER